MINTIMPYLEGSPGALLNFAAGLVAVVILQVWLPALAFRVRWWWGLVALVPLVGPTLYSFWNWQAAKRPFVMGLLALISAVVLFKLRELSGGPWLPAEG